MKTYLGITGSTYDAFLTEQLNLVSDTVEAYCRRKFELLDYVQTYYYGDYIPSLNLQTSIFPATVITSVVEDGVTVSAADYRVHKPSATIIRTAGMFFYAEETVVTYTAGYATIPTPIDSVVKTVVQERYNKKVSGVDLNFGSDVQRVSIPGTISIDFDYTLSNNDRKSAYGVILGSQVNVLDDWRSDRAVLGEGKLIFNEEV
jgi:hypothetical protein